MFIEKAAFSKVMPRHAKFGRPERGRLVCKTKIRGRVVGR